MIQSNSGSDMSDRQRRLGVNIPRARLSEFAQSSLVTSVTFFIVKMKLTVHFQFKLMISRFLKIICHKQQIDTFWTLVLGMAFNELVLYFVKEQLK